MGHLKIMKMYENESNTKSTIRIDKWLWYSRFFRTRRLAQQICIKKSIRVNGIRVTKSNKIIKKGDIVTFQLRKNIIVIRVLKIPKSRQSAQKAMQLYEELVA